MKNVLLQFIFIMLTVFYVSGQVPGYRGKKLQFGYAPQIGYCIVNPNNNGNRVLNLFFTEDQFDAMNLIPYSFKHSFNVYYTNTFNSSIGFEFKTWNSHYYLHQFGLPTSIYHYETSPNWPYNVIQTRHDFEKNLSFGMTSRAYGIKYRKFKESFAPLGSYFEQSLYLVSSVSDLSELDIPPIINSLPKDHFVRTTQFTYMISTGKQQAIGRHILFYRSLDLGLTLPVKPPLGASMLSDPEEVSVISESYVKDRMKKRIFSGLLINFTLGLSLIL